MRILVTGHTGFIGRNLMEWLNQEEEWLVDGWSWDPNNYPDVKNYNWVIHLGAVTDTSDVDIDTIIHKNYEFSQWLFNECNKNKVHMQYIDDNFLGNISLFEDWVFTQPIHIFVQIFKYHNIYGRYMHLSSNKNMITHWIEEARTSNKISVWKDSDKFKQDWVWVGDVCRLQIYFIKNINGSGAWEAGSGMMISFYELAGVIADVEDVPILITNDICQLPKKIKTNLTLLKNTIKKWKWASVVEYINR